MIDRFCLWLLRLGRAGGKGNRNCYEKVTHELLHYFIDEYEEQVAAGLPKIIRQKYVSDVVLQNFLKQKQERIVIEVAEIIVRKSLATFIIAE
jgi:hypothetical protein